MMFKDRRHESRCCICSIACWLQAQAVHSQNLHGVPAQRPHSILESPAVARRSVAAVPVHRQDCADV